MSRIQQTQIYHRSNGLMQNASNVNYAYKQNFGGADNAMDDAIKFVSNKTVKQVDKSFTSLLSRFGKWSNKFLNDHDGEIQTQVINAFFTTTLAPLMISKNPFSKKDKKTRDYSALRQPVSAIIAVSGGLLMTIGTNKYSDYLCSEGRINSIDGRIEPTEKYLKSMFKREIKSFKKDPDKIKKFLNDHSPSIYEFEGEKFNSDGTPTGKYIRACREKYIEDVHSSREALFTNLIGSDPKDIKVNENVISIMEKTDKGVNPKEIGRNIPRLGSDDDLQKYWKENNFYKKNLGDLLRQEYGVEIYPDGALTGKIKDSSLEKLKKADGLEFMKKLGLVGENTKINDKVIDEKMLNKLLQNNDGEKLSASKVLECLDLGGKKLNGSLDIELKNVIDVAVDKLKLGAKEAFESKTYLDFAGNIVKNMKSRLGKDSKAFKGFAGILFNVPMTMVTCTLLNILYPKFVDAFFPQLSKSKKPVEMKGGNK